MKTFVEFYFPGLSLEGKHEREVSSREVEAIASVPQHAVSFRFFNKDDSQHKFNYSPFFFFGTEYSMEEFSGKYPQLANDYDLSEHTERICKSRTGSFYPLSKEDIVVPA